MQSNTSNRIIKAISIISISVFVVFVIRFVVSFVSFVMSIMSIGSSEPAPTDKQMIEHFRQNEKSFDRLLCLSSFPESDKDTLDEYYPLHLLPESERIRVLSFYALIEADSLFYYNLLPVREENDDIRYLSRADREKEQKQLMEKLKISSCTRLTPYRRENSIKFNYFYEGGPIKGYEYVYDRTEDDPRKKFIETDENIDDLLQKLDESSLYKKIDDHWGLFIMR